MSKKEQFIHNIPEISPRKLRKSNLTNELETIYMEKFKKISNIINNINNRSINDPNAKFDNLYSLLSKPELLIQSVGNLRANQGASTPGTSSETLAGISISKIQNLALCFKNKSFKFSPYRRIYIPKPGKKKLRPLGIPNFTDRIIQDAIRIILEAIYEPEFSRIHDQNYGFRKNKDAQQAVKFISRQGTGLNYALEGDIVGAYDNVQIPFLIKILKKKIIDQDFLNLIEQGCHCGLLEFGKYKDTLLGIPQGGIASPLLFNIYMHEFDLYINHKLKNIIDRYNTLNKRNSRTQRNLSYEALNRNINSTKKEISIITRTRKIRELSPTEKALINAQIKQKKKILSDRTKTLTYIPEKRPIKILYCRYADDWILLTNSNLKFIKLIKKHITKWLKNNLKLDLSEEKTYITNIENKFAKFLGFTLFSLIHPKIKISSSYSSNGSKTLIRTGSHTIRVGIDMDRILKRLYINGFCNKKFFPQAKKPYSNLPSATIIEKYNSIIRGTANYFIPVLTQIQPYPRIHYILEYSCYHTLAMKYKTSISKLFKKYGHKHPNFPISMEITNKRTGIRHNITKNHRVIPYLIAKANAKLIRHNVSSDVFQPMKKINWRSYKNLEAYCIICGTRENIEWHHVRSIRKGKVTGFTQVMKQLNRKQVPLCKQHHLEVTQGKYDQTKISDLVHIDYWLA